ncbi:MAG: phosphoribosylformylglycinamidine synthase subunit PurS [Phycisphaerae bacterium]|nr:phosphoribosylformylglycinamidine synthase subunit PurS [Phycisphaerae bacterium]
MMHRVEVRTKERFGDPHAEGILAQIRELGVEAVRAVRSARLFFLAGDLSDADARRVARELLADPVTEVFFIGASDEGDARVIEVHLQPGVMDPVAASAEGAIRDMGIDVRAVRTGRRYELTGEVTDEQRQTIATKLLANAVIENVFFEAHTPPESQSHSYKLKVVDVPIRDLDDAGLEKLSRDGDLFLNLTEMKAIQDHYRAQGREPRDVELEMIAQTWSEHCGHKTFRSDVRLKNRQGNLVEEIPNLIKNTIFGATRELNKSWCLNVFEDNAGVIEFDDEWAVGFKVETHNHPSAIEPYGGASTGIGGVVRDPMGTGLGAKPFANTDVFCFGDVTMDLSDVPAGALHPKRVMRGVVSGVRDYGNRMGIPTVNGAVYFDDRYVGNPLVFCGTAAVMPKSKCTKQRPNPGDAILCVGGRTGRDGIHGATFSSGELTHQHETEFSHAVQIGNAITEKKVLDTILQARDEGLFSCITDCGAGGLSSSVGEMGEKIGAEVHLDRVPLKYAGLSYSEIWISEAQERMTLAVPRENVERILKIFADENVEATVIGHFGSTGEAPAKPEAGSGRQGAGNNSQNETSSPVLRLFYNNTLVGELDMEFLHDGLPRPTKDAVWDVDAKASPAPPKKDNYNETLLKILAAPNVASKEWIIRQYDHEVQGGSVVKPLVGAAEDGPGDGAVSRPVLGSNRGVALACGMNPHFGDLDPYQSALHAVDEALRNVVAVGGDLERTAVLDNFCWGNCNKPDRMGALVRAALACRDAAMTYSVPFISGKDSLNNEFQTSDGQTIAIPYTLLISAISVVPDVTRCVTSDAKKAGNLLYLLGETRPELGGSHYLRAEGLQTGNDVPPVNPAVNVKTMRAMQKAIFAGLVRGCHDLSEGGLAVAAAESAFAGGLGVEISLANVPTAAEFPGDDTPAGRVAKLFGESAGRFLVEIEPEKAATFEKLFAGLACAQMGKVTDTGRIVIDKFIDLEINDAKAAWQGTFDW